MLCNIILDSRNPDGERREFDNYRWVDPQEAEDLAHNDQGGDAVTYQRQQMYKQVFEEFGLLKLAPVSEHRPGPT